MKVNQNVSAVISNAQLHRAENKLTASIERLSSGYKLNKAKDSPAGMAISNKMRAQIMALDQSSRNAADGTSVMQTADGALNETHAMLQRIRELCVQAATDTLTTEDKEACQEEIAALQAEIDRIATDTEFNGKRILDGSQDYRIYPSVYNDTTKTNELASTYIRNFQTSDEVSPEDYKFNIKKLPEQATTDYTMNLNALPWKTEKEGDNAVEVTEIKINECPVKIYKTDTPDDIYKKMRAAGELGGVKVEQDQIDPDKYTLTSFEYGKSAKISVTSEQSVSARGKDAQPGKNAEPAVATLELDQNFAGVVEINGHKVKIDATDSSLIIAQKLQDAGDLAGVTVAKEDPTDPNNYNYVLTTKASGESAKIDATAKASLATAEGVDTQIKLIRDTDQKKDSNGTGMVDADGNPVLYGEGFSNTAIYSSDGKKVSIRDLNGFEMIFEIDPEKDMNDTLDGVAANGSVEVNLEMTDIGSMTLQIGTHEHQIVDVRIPAVTCESLYIDELNVVRKGGADKAITALDGAIAQVSAVRSRIGAYQNRLDYAVSSLDATEENMEAAISRVMDTDMAEEMSVYSNMNVLDQAAISVLTQANDMPQQVLQLLQ